MERKRRYQPKGRYHSQLRQRDVDAAADPEEAPEDEAQIVRTHRRPSPDSARFRETRHYQRGRASSYRGRSTRYTNPEDKTGESSQNKAGHYQRGSASSYRGRSTRYTGREAKTGESLQNKAGTYQRERASSYRGRGTRHTAPEANSEELSRINETKPFQRPPRKKGGTKPHDHSQNTSKAASSGSAIHPRVPVESKDRSYNIYRLSQREVFLLCSGDSASVVNGLYPKIKAFQNTLQESQRIQKLDVMDALVLLMSKIAKCLQGPTSESSSQAALILGEALSERCHAFQVRLKLYVSRDLSLRGNHPMEYMHLYTTKARVERVLELFQILLESLPDSSWSCLPVLELQIGICRLSTNDQSEITADHELQAKQIVEHFNEIRDDKCRMTTVEEISVTDTTRDNSEYRQLSILPQWEEISSVDCKLQLRPNIIRGCYTDWMHYYNIHFHLLREDFIAPLRRGICSFLQGARGRKLQDVKAYEHIRIIQPVISSEGVSYELKFDVRHLKRCKWEHSKRLLYGALLCLSPDNFKEVALFATVSNREPDELKQGKVMVRFEGEYNIQKYIGKQTFSMVESLAYFEACRHILSSLQQTEVDTMPFSQYILQNECKSVSPPNYITRNPELCYNLSCLLSDTFIEKDDSTVVSLHVNAQSERHVKLLDKYQWPSLEEMELDSSQLEAIQMALTQEIAVIQGPPGTGKTYIGLKAVQVLLMNRHVWDPKKESPIIVMCLTNHALDQFLEGILAIFNHEQDKQKKVKIVRIGARSKSEVIQQLNITKVVKNVYIPHHINEEVYDCRDDVDLATTMVKRTRSRMLKFFRPYLFSLQELSEYQVIDPWHYYQLRETLESPEEMEKSLEIWLGIYRITYRQLKITNTKSIQDTPNVENDDESSEDESVEVSSPINVLQDAPMDLSESKCQDTRRIIPSDTEISTKTVSDTDHLPDLTTTSKRDSSTESNSDDEESDSDEERLIDIKGEASIEQEARLVGNQPQNWLRLNDVQVEEQYEPESRMTHDELELDDIYEDNQTTVTDRNEEATITISVRSLQKCEDARGLIAAGRAYGPMSQDEVADVQNINALDHTNRWRLYNHWVNCCIKQLSETYEDQLTEYERCCRRKKAAMQRADRYALETADIVGMTTTGAAKYQHILHLVKPRIIIVEEAAEVLESHIVAGLTAGTQHLILIGDHKQLRPKPNEYELAKKYKLDISLFERLILNNFPHATLQIQHRMRPEIARLVKPHIYSTLINHESVQNYGDVKGIDFNLYFIQHEFPEMEDENLISHSNEHEAKFLTALCEHILKQGYKPSQITILVTYSGQLLLMRSRMPRAVFEGVRVCTVDNFQGEENDIILLSLVRSNAENKIGFLREENRVCVAMSRAKMGFYCIGNFKMLKYNAPIWEAIMSDMERKNLIGEVLPLHCTNHSDTRYVAKTSNDFKQFSPHGGCLKDCEYRLPCGHACILKCHIQDPEHKEYQCNKPCARKCPEGHSCQRLCNVKCKCMVKVIRTMPDCEHSQEMYCYEDPVLVECMNPCKEKCRNGHLCPQLCHEWCRPCVIIMQKEMPKCGHMRSVECYRYSNFNLCDAACDKKCDNGHPCLRKCHELCGRCEVKVLKKIPVCGHSILLQCYSLPDHSLCTEQCEQLLACGHRCPLRCSVPCTIAICKVKVNITLDCGHSVSMKCSESTSLRNKFCDKPCERTLPCGHKCTMKCGQQCTQKCAKKVAKKWPCGHKLKRPCFQLLQPSEYPCNKKCKTIFQCGHPCPNVCGKPCADTCNVKVDKECPCGHINMISCSITPTDAECSQRCKAILSCGHRCDGKCSQCIVTQSHEPCKYETVAVRFCGHRIQVPCQDVSDHHPGRKVCTSSCAHRKCESDCTVKCLKCDLPCAWSCPHFKCTKLCHEICDRPVCNKRCRNTLPCGHQCFGVCGEPCLSICPLCQRKKFNKKLKLATFSDKKQYVQLPCDHILTVELLDEDISKQSRARQVLPLLCPVTNCFHRIPASYRYGNAAKGSLHNVVSVHEIIESKRATTVLEGKEILQLSFRLDNLLQGHTSAKRYVSWDQKNQALYRDPTDGTFHQYEPFPQISSCILTLQRRLSSPEQQYSTQGQEKFIIYLLLNVIRLLNIASDYQLNEESLTDIKKQVTLGRHLQWFALYVVHRWKERSSRLSHQMVVDFQHEIFQSSILIQYCLLNRLPEQEQSSCSAYILQLKEFLIDCANNPEQRVTHHQYTELTIAGQHLKSIPSIVSCEQLLSDIDKSLPLITKGDWWKCVNNHYYCTPFTTSGHDRKTPNCPFCVLD